MGTRLTIGGVVLLVALAWLTGAGTSTTLVAEQAEPPAPRTFLYTQSQGRLLRFDTAVIEQHFETLTEPVLHDEISLPYVGAGVNQAGDIILSRDGRFAYVTATSGDVVHVVDVATSPMTLVTTIPVGDGPQGIDVDDRGFVYVANELSQTVSVIDAVGNTVVQTIVPGGSARDVAVTPDGNLLFVALVNDDSMAVVDVSLGSVERVPMPSPPSRRGDYKTWSVSLSPRGHAWVANRGMNRDGIIVFDAVAPYDLQRQWDAINPAAVAFNADATWAYIAGGGYYAWHIWQYDHTLWADVTPSRYSGGRDVAVHPDGTRTYVTGASRAGGFGLGVWDNTITTPTQSTQPPMTLVIGEQPYGSGWSVVLGPEVGDGGGSGTGPSADAGLDQTLEATGPSTSVTLDASLSTGEAPLGFSWTGPFPEGEGTVIGVSPTVTLPVGTHEITLTITDGSSVTGTDVVLVTVTDTSPPVISGVEESMTREGNTPGGALIPFSPLASDLVDGDVTMMVTSDAPADNFFPLGGPTLVTFTATDSLGNTATKTTTVTVVDNTPPEFTTEPADITVPGTESGGGAIVLLETLGAVVWDVVDGGGDLLTIISDLPPVCQPGDTVVTITVTDGSGNSDSRTVTVTVVDETPPSFTWVPSDVTVEATGVTTPFALDAPTTDDAGPVTITSDAPEAFPLGSTTVTFTATDAAENSATAQTVVIVTDTTAPIISEVPGPQTVEGNALGGATLALGSPQVTDADPDATVTSNAPDIFPVGATTVTFTATDAGGHSATATTVVTVVDTTPPDLTGVPGDLLVQPTELDGWADVALVFPTFVDLVDGPIDSETVQRSPSSPCHCAPGVTVVTFTASDASGNTATATATVTVNRPPQIVMLDSHLSVVEGDQASATGTFGDPDAVELGDTVTLIASRPGLVLVGGSWSWSELVPNDPGSGSVVITATDARGGAALLELPVTVQNAVPVVTSVEQPLDPIQLGDAATVTAHFTDAGVLDTHTCSVNWDDGQPAMPGEVAEAGGSGSCTATYPYIGAGVYAATVTVTDDDGGSATRELDLMVVYDPSGGFVTGGGWIDSAPGSYAADPSQAGKANFGFVAKYKKNGTVPTGQTEFQFKAGDVNFHIDAYDWLVVVGPIAQFQGYGTVNGSGDYGFQITVHDAKLTPEAGDVDRFRISIWDRITGAMFYDNVPGAPSFIYDANPQELDKGSIVIHTQGN